GAILNFQMHHRTCRGKRLFQQGLRRATKTTPRRAKFEQHGALHRIYGSKRGLVCRVLSIHLHLSFTNERSLWSAVKRPRSNMRNVNAMKRDGFGALSGSAKGLRYHLFRARRRGVAFEFVVVMKR